MISFSLFLSLSLLLLSAYVQADNSCLSPTGQIQWKATDGSCARGYHCANLDPDNETTWMAICTPTVACQQERLNSEFCTAPQGQFEPYPCPEGSHCPNATAVLPCPKGHFCPVATATPFDCGWGLCPGEKNVRPLYFFPIVIALLFDLAILCCIWLPKRNASRGVHTQQHGRPNVAARLKALLYPYDATSAALGSNQDATLELLRAIQSTRDGAPATSLIFENISYSLHQGRTKLLCHATGSFPAGQLTAIMGPSGAGKTTLLRCLLNQWAPDTGRVWLECSSHTAGSIAPPGLRERGVVGYVPQASLLFPRLTVRENIFHAALVNLPRTRFSHRAVAGFVNNICRALGLTGCANHVVGDGHLTAGVSGGERKRCSVGVALAAAPLILLLDEPTSGLDSTSALAVMQLLHRLARLGLTVAAVIHQPRPEVYVLCDQLVLLRPVGHVLYSGPRADALCVLAAKGEVLTAAASAYLAAHSGPKGEAVADVVATNPADLIIDVAGGCVTPSAEAGAGEGSGEEVLPGEVPPCVDYGALAEAMRLSTNHAALVYPGVMAQTIWCFQRSLLEQYRDAKGFATEVFIALLAGGLMGASANRTDRIYQGLLPGPQSLQSPAPNDTFVGLLGFFIGLSIAVVASPAAVKVFGTELQQFWREADAGHSRMAYMVGKFMAMLPRLTLSALHFSGLFYALVRPRTGFGIMFCMTWLHFFCVFAVAAIISIRMVKANSALVAVIVTMALSSLNGNNPSLRDMKDAGVGPLLDLFYARWCTGAFISAELGAWRGTFDVPRSLDNLGFDLTLPSVQLAYAAGIGAIVHAAVFVTLECSYRRARRSPRKRVPPVKGQSARHLQVQHGPMEGRPSERTALLE